MNKYNLNFCDDMIKETRTVVYFSRYTEVYPPNITI